MDEQIKKIFSKISTHYDARYLDNVSDQVKEIIYKITQKYKNKGEGNTTVLTLINNYFTKNKPVAKNISGPLRVVCLKKGVKTFYLFGENHGYKNDCADQKRYGIPIQDYLLKLFETSDVFIDFFLEIPPMIPQKLTKESRKIYMNRIRLTFRNCSIYKLWEKCRLKHTMRAHYIDIRTQMTLTKSMFFNYSLFFIVPDEYRSKLEEWIWDNIVGFAKDIKKHMNNLDTFTNYIIKDARSIPLINKELNRSIEEKNIVLFTKQQIIDTIERDMGLKIFGQIISSIAAGYKPIDIQIYALIDIFASIAALMTDMYTLSRIFKRFKVPKGINQPVEPTHIIVYTGDAHTKNYIKFIKKLGFIQVGSAHEYTRAWLESGMDPPRCLNMYGI